MLNATRGKDIADVGIEMRALSAFISAYRKAFGIRPDIALTETLPAATTSASSSFLQADGCWALKLGGESGKLGVFQPMRSRYYSSAFQPSSLTRNFSPVPVFV